MRAKRLYYRPYGYKEKLAVEFWKELSSDWSSSEINNFKKALVVIDVNVEKRFIERILKVLQRNKLKFAVVEANVASKSLENLTKIWQTAVKFSPDVFIGIGGGTVSDIVGFAAATYQRGTPYILFPTTVLGMVDASVGGKTGIDYGGAKNSIGAIHYPLLTVNVLSHLESLPKRDFIGGFSEVVKAAVLFDKELFERLEKLSQKYEIKPTDGDLLYAMKRTVYHKMKNSQKAPYFKDRLLYGHAVGHAVEMLVNGSRHGECVAIGMSVEGGIAQKLGFWKQEDWARQNKVLQNLGLPISFPRGVRLDLLFNKMALTKKLSNGKEFLFVFPERIGKAARKNGIFLTPVDKYKLKRVLSDLRTNLSS